MPFSEGARSELVLTASYEENGGGSFSGLGISQSPPFFFFLLVWV